MKTKLILGCLIAASAAFGSWKIFANQNNAPLTDLQLANAEALASPERSGTIVANCVELASSETVCSLKCPNCLETFYSEDGLRGVTNESSIKGICPLCGYSF